MKDQLTIFTGTELKERGMITQKQKIKEWLLKHGSITSRQAWGMFGITRLSSIINRLRNEGLEIISIQERNVRFNWVRYKLII